MLAISLILRAGIISIFSHYFPSLLIRVMKCKENNWTHNLLHYYIYILKTLVRKKNGQDKEHMNPNFKYINIQRIILAEWKCKRDRIEKNYLMQIVYDNIMQPFSSKDV